MRFATTATIAAILGLTVASAHAAPKGAVKAHGPTAKTAAPKTIVVKPAKAPKMQKVTGAPKSPKSPKSIKPPKLAKATATSSTTHASGATAPATTGSVTPSTIDFTSAPVGAKLAKNPALRAKVESRLTTLGYTGSVYEAAYGFKNQGQFVAATNVSRNLGVPFDQLKLQMTGLSVAPNGTVLQANLGSDGTITMVDPKAVTKPAPTKSLGQSIQTVKSGVNATAAAETATAQASTEIATTAMTAER